MRKSNHTNGFYFSGIKITLHGVHVFSHRCMRSGEEGKENRTRLFSWVTVVGREMERETGEKIDNFL